MGDRYHPDHGITRPAYRDERNDRRDRDGRYAYEDRYEHYDRYDRFDRPRSRSPPRRGYDRFDDRYTNRDDGYRRENVYSFRGAADRDSRGQAYRSQLPQSDFTFRASGPPAPKFPEKPRRPPAPFPDAMPARAKDSRRDQGKRIPPGQHVGKTAESGARGRFRKPPPHQRDILRRQEGGSTPEQLYGMNEDGQARFKEANFSSSDEHGSEDGEIDDSATDEGEGPRKRAKADVTESAEQPAPKWSNPEYFTALPPPESSLGPKKDIVQVIRKAKVEQAAKQNPSNAVKENVDFISFNMDDDSDDMLKLESIKLSENEKSKKQKSSKNVPSPPTKPRNQVQLVPQDDTEPKKRPFMQSVSPPLPFRSFKLPKVNKSKDPARPPPPSIDDLMNASRPPRPSASIEDLIAKADRTQPKKQPPANSVPQQCSQPQGKKRKAAQISKGLGDVVTEWRSNGVNPTPWCIVDHTRTANVGLRLHKEIADFYEFVRPHDYEEAVRRELIQRVQSGVQSFKNEDARQVEIRSFGSFASGVYLPTADMDLVAVSPEYLRTGRKVFCQSSTKLYKLGAHLVNCNVALPGTLTVVAKAKVPIIKFIEKQTGIKVDISFENDTGLVALQTFAEWKEKYPAMSVIVVLIKQMLAMRALNEVFLGGLGGFSIICLVVSLMQHMPEIQSGNMDPSLHYGDLLLNFLDLYGNKFNVQTTGITMNPPSYFDKIRYPHQKQNAMGLTIVDPNKPDNDISGGSNKIGTVFECFRTAQSEIQRRLYQIHSGESVEDSILGVVLAGNYTAFFQQRNHLSVVHRGRPASPLPGLKHDERYLPKVPSAPGKAPRSGPNNRGRGRGRGRGGKYAANGSTHPAPQPQTLNEAYNAGPKKYVDLYIAPQTSPIDMYGEIQEALNSRENAQ